MNKTLIIIEREFLTRVQKKSFILLTIFMPFIFAALIFVPVMLAQIKDDEQKEVTLIDRTGLYAAQFADDASYRFVPAHKLDAESESEATVVITDNLARRPDAVQIYSRKEVSPDLLRLVETRLNERVRHDRLEATGIAGIEKIVEELDNRVNVRTVKWDEKGEETSSSTAVAMGAGFLIALLCVLFYSCVFPFQKFATELMTSKYHVDENLAGLFAGLPALGALLLTPVFGGMIDRVGRAATIMMFGSAMLIGVHAVYALPFVHAPAVAIALMIVLGVAFSLVPSAMWPSVAKIFPVKQLGTAYALIFFIQNIGLFGVPALIGWTLETKCKLPGGGYDYTLPMTIFTGIACLALVVAFLLKAADRKFGYGLEQANLKKK